VKPEREGSAISTTPYPAGTDGSKSGDRRSPRDALDARRGRDPCCWPRPCLGQATLAGVLHAPLCHDTVDAIDTPTNARAVLATIVTRMRVRARLIFVPWHEMPLAMRTIRYSHANSLRGVQCPYSVCLRIPRDYAEIACQGLPC